MHSSSDKTLQATCAIWNVSDFSKAVSLGVSGAPTLAGDWPKLLFQISHWDLNGTQTPFLPIFREN